jgi:Uma2 family endonuclease
MNEHVRPRDFEPPIRTLEELARRRWTTAELLALQERGGVVPDLEYELIDGEIVPVPSEGPAHLDLSDELAWLLVRRATGGLRVVSERQFNLTEKTHVTPDIVFRPASIRMSALRGPDALLVIEIADTRFDYNTTTKAALYAAHGVREYWVINARTLVTTVFRDPVAGEYTNVTTHEGSQLLAPHLAPALAVRLGDLDRSE